MVKKERKPLKKTHALTEKKREIYKKHAVTEMENYCRKKKKTCHKKERRIIIGNMHEENEKGNKKNALKKLDTEIL